MTTELRIDWCADYAGTRVFQVEDDGIDIRETELYGVVDITVKHSPGSLPLITLTFFDTIVDETGKRSPDYHRHEDIFEVVRKPGSGSPVADVYAEESNNV